MFRRRAAQLLLAGVLLPSGLAAQSMAGDGARPVVSAYPLTDAVELDGRLDEGAWARATPVTAFTQNDPQEGRPVSQPTEVRILYDGTALYVGAVLHDELPPSARLGRRDAWLQDSDWFSVSLDSYHDHLTGYRFQVNPLGVRSDEVLSGGNERRGDDSWDPVWEVATTVSDSGWVAEMRIPFSQLRFDEADVQRWGIQLERTIARRQENAVMAFTPKSERAGIARWGHLDGMEDLHRGGGFELLPYAVARAEYIAPTQEDVSFPNPYRDGSEYFGDVGVDLKYRVASNLTLDATVNPDFGQVEVDPAVVNLTAFETRFQERRPFFVEGSDIFSFGSGGGGGGFRGGFGGGGFGGGTQLLYSRRIGGAPRWSAPDEAVYENAPDEATILAAAKLTGRTAGGWTLGLMDAVTDREVARFTDLDGDEGSQVAAPRTNYFVGRARKHIREGQTVFGGMLTAVHRNMENPALRDGLRDRAWSGGLDFVHEFADRAWSLSGWAAASRVHGSAEAIADAQTSSARYFDRPDADHLDYDPRATSLSGWNAKLELEKRAGLHWRGSVETTVTSPGFEVNDLGFQRDADRVESQGSLRYQETRPGRHLRSWNVQLNPEATWNFGGTRVGGRVSTEIQGQLLNYWGGELRYTRSLAAYDDRLTRGGPLARRPAGNRLSFRLDSDERKAWTIRANGSLDWDEAGGREREIRLDMGFRPNDVVSVSLSPNVSTERSPAQYVGSQEDPEATGTFGRRWIFAELDQTTVSLETRVNFTFQPGLTLEIWAQPFLASAAFDRPGELAAPRTFDFLRYGEDVGTLDREDGDFVVDPDGPGPAEDFTLDDEDFNRRSLRGSAVLRWEWRPGSTLYLVWQQVRSDRVDLDDLSLDRDLRGLFGAPADDVFVLKVSYWLGF